MLKPEQANASSTIFGGGPFYSGGTATMNTLRASGYTTVMLWTIHVYPNGDLVLNDQLVAANGAYVGHAAWPGQLATLKTQPTSVNRIEISVGSWGVNDFLTIQTLMNTHGTNTDSILYRNFQALKMATGADAVDFDDETLYDVTTAVKFGRMLSSIGYKVTLCPYTNPSFWQAVYNQLGTGIVDAVYLQCYAGGAGNNPATWNGYFSGTKVEPGLWCRHGGGCAEGRTASEVGAQMTSWRNATGIPGGFMWLYDDMLACSTGGTPADYAAAINQAVNPLLVTPDTGFDGVTAYNTHAVPTLTPFTLRNTGPAEITWSLTKTSAWLTAAPTGGKLAPNASTTVNVSLNLAAALSLAPDLYSSSVLFSNHTSAVAQARRFTLNTAIANWPVTVSGFNAVLLAPHTATPANPGATAFDLPNNYCFYQAGAGGGSRGLPYSPIFPSLSDAGTAFQLGAYGTTNALLLGYDHPASGTLTLASPKAYHSLAVLACSANGGGLGSCVIRFADGSHSPAFNFNAQDWFFHPNNVALQGFGRLKLGPTLNYEDNGASNPNLYQTTLNLASAGLTQAVTSITFTPPASGGGQQTTAIFGLSGMSSDSPLLPPANLTATPGTNAHVELAWNATPGALHYLIKRSIISGTGYVVVGSTSSTSFTDTGLGNGSNYFFVVSAVGTSQASPDSNEVSAMPGSFRSWLLAANPVAWWPLNEPSGAPTFDQANGNNGLCVGGYVRNYPGAQGDGFDSPHAATHYDGVSAYTQLPRVIGSTDFTLSFWVQTTANGGTPNWYNGRGLVDGEVAGVVNDFGVALVGNRVGFGVGNPDLTLTSIRPINNGLWHQVTVTRQAATGAMKIYIDGTLDVGTTGPTGARTAPPTLRLGSLQTGGGYLNGNLSDVAAFDRVLGANEIATLYSAATGLFYDITLTTQWNGTNLVLSWPGNGKLLEAPEITGPWTTNYSSSPVILPPSQSRKFFRIQTQ